MEKALKLYIKASESNCSKAFNSIGNMVAKNKISLSKFKVLDAKNYYKSAAKLGNVFGMSNYACVLEKELKQEKKLRDEGKSKHEDAWIIKTGKDMIKNFEASADLGYDYACLKAAQYYGNFEKSEIVNFNAYGISFIEFNIDKAIQFLQRCIRSPQNDVAALSGVHLAEFSYKQGNEKARKDAVRILHHVSSLNISRKIRGNISSLLDVINKDAKIKDYYD